jgi:hypothetical protein
MAELATGHRVDLCLKTETSDLIIEIILNKIAFSSRVGAVLL